MKLDTADLEKIVILCFIPYKQLTYDLKNNNNNQKSGQKYPRGTTLDWNRFRNLYCKPLPDDKNNRNHFQNISYDHKQLGSHFITHHPHTSCEKIKMVLKNVKMAVDWKGFFLLIQYLHKILYLF